MNSVDILVHQTGNAYDWVHRLLGSVPQEKWDDTPEVIDSNISWQVGHLIMSYYYHAVMVIVGHQSEIIQKIPLKEYDLLFTDATARAAIGKAPPVTLKEQLDIV